MGNTRKQVLAGQPLTLKREKMLSSEYKFSSLGAKVVFKTKLRGKFWLKTKHSNISPREWSQKEGLTAGVALAELNLLNDTFEDQIKFTEDGVMISHFCLAKLSANSLKLLGLPNNPNSKFLLSLRGDIGGSDFDLKYQWKDLNGTEETGAFLRSDTDDFIIPDPIFSIIELIKEFREANSAELQNRWELISKVKNLIDHRKPINSDFSEIGRRELAELQGYLRDIKIKTASALSLNVQRTADGVTFTPVLFGAQNEEDNQRKSEDDGLLTQLEQVSFDYGKQSFANFDNVKKTYLIKTGEYLLIEDNLYSALEVVKEKQKASAEEREEFASNPGKAFSECFEGILEETDPSEDVGPEDDLAQEKEEAVQKTVASIFVETKEFSDRVIGLGLWKPPALPYVEKVDNEWVPETFGLKIGDVYLPVPVEDVIPLREAVQQAIDAREKSIFWKDVEIQADVHTLDVLNQLDGLMPTGPRPEPGPKRESKHKHVLVVKENFEKLNYLQGYFPRKTKHTKRLPENIIATLKSHQEKSFDWMVECYLNGFPGVLNADDQGLGKTLQSISFMAWLQEHQKVTADQPLRPILVVAPTSLLRNWQDEVDLHMDGKKLGITLEAYGTSLKDFRVKGLRGIDMDDANKSTRLDFSKYIRSDKPAPTWILTTYKTLTNYAQSFGHISFAAVIFDEVQNLKTPGNLQSNAAKNLKADFKIGLTGTPVENALSDLWTIMDILVPGYLSSLTEFHGYYAKAGPERLKELYDRIFEHGVNRVDGKTLPPLGIRRMKSEAAKDLPLKKYEKYPLDMDGIQEEAYDQILHTLKLDEGGSAFSKINKLRSLSLHPEKLELAYKEEEGVFAFLQKSARIRQTIQILKSIKGKNEKALIFLETREMQYLLQEFFRTYFSLDKIDIINGDVPVSRRASIVKDFQDKINDNKFSLLILGPKSAGVGLTLTAATHVIHLSRWWNPAVEEQCNDRVYRIGQAKDVTIHIPLAIHPKHKSKSFDCTLNNIMHRKRALFQSVLMPATLSNEQESKGIRQIMVAKDDEKFLPLIDGKTGVQFEKWIGETARSKGPWIYSATPITGDGGADIILSHTERLTETIIIQAKHTNRPEQNLHKSAVEEVIRSQAFYLGLKNTRLLVITNYANFSQPAIDLAAENNVKLVARDNLCLWPNHII